ncbi:hypothetical protein SAMN05421863_102532 [Nitrosomonas communis]|uniref:Uncharacterized protein n=1 Tax=Nitrosomonas communis TaxID=44574 RepID=A0A1I4Q8I2_9PROT|nr:hypothetical protein [Nitrosomonas communis]SFM36402.1 hypothetical protein SAMN05421863_102532 [Nitrosomonas communis]
MIERKGIDAIYQDNYLKVFMVTNNDYAVPASKDERRYCVFDVSNTRIGDKCYFNALNAACNDKAIQSAFLFEMLNRDISNFKVSAIPESQGLKDQRLHSLKSPGKWLVDSFTQGYFDVPRFDEDECKTWQQEVSSEKLYKSYKFWCDSNKLGQYNIVNKNLLGRYLSEIFTKKKLRGDIRGFVLGSLMRAIGAFEKYERVSLDIDFDTDEKQDGINLLSDCANDVLELETPDFHHHISCNANARANVTYTNCNLN